MQVQILSLALFGSRDILILVMKKKLAIIVLILLIAIGSFFFFRAKAQGAPFKIETVQSGEMKVSLPVSGEVKAEKDATVSFPASGLLSWVGVKKGDPVKKGQALASLDTRDLRKKLDKTLNLYLTQRNSFEQTQEDYKDDKEKLLLTDEIRRILNTTQNSLNNAVLDVELNDLTIRLATIHSPFEGIVASDTPYAGINITFSGAGFRIIDPKSLYFEALVDETDVPKIKTGDKVNVRLDAFLNETFEATISKIDYTSSLSSSGGTVYKTEIIFSDSTDLFRLGMNGDAEILLMSIDEAVLTPLSALTEKEGKTYVWKIEDDKAKKTEIIIENINDDFAQVISGLSCGDKVVASNTSLVKEGMVIKP